MALPPLATLDDLEVWLGASVNASRADAILSAASTLIRSHTARVWVDADGDPEDGVTDLQVEALKVVTVHVAARVYTNPNGNTQEATGPFSHTVAAWSAYGLSLTGDEKALLPRPATGVPGLSSVRVLAPSGATGTRSQAYGDSELCEGDEA